MYGKIADLDAKPATRIGRRAEPQLGIGDPKRPAHDRVHRIRPLEIGEHVIDAFRGMVVCGNDEALDRGVRAPWEIDRQIEDMVGLSERGFRIAVAEKRGST